MNITLGWKKTHDFCLYGREYGDGHYTHITTAPQPGSVEIPFDKLPSGLQKSYWDLAILAVGNYSRNGFARGYSESDIFKMRRNLLLHYFRDELHEDLSDK
jgi:hypothetical protein